jgi:hypothetical protein
MEEEPLIETMEKNRSLETQQNIIDHDEKRMKLNLQKLHVKREIW